jgi:hypothetical protein
MVTSTKMFKVGEDTTVRVVPPGTIVQVNVIPSLAA